MNFKFIKYTKLWFLLSTIAVAISLGALFNNGIKLGIDFTGGTLMELQFENEEITEIAEVTEVIEAAQPDYLSQMTLTGEGTFLIQGKDLPGDTYDGLKASIEAELGAFEEIRFTTIGPKIGETLKQKAIVALGIALVAIVLFIAYAFRHVPKRVSAWRFGFCAIAALAHDIIITLGIFAILGFEVDAFFITALLTIMGFSVHDTIVVFDRIRENLKTQSRQDSFSDVADKSLNQTLMRSINTSVSTLITLAALYYLGAESLGVFIFALIIGIWVGTYSSIFLASPLLTAWQSKANA